MTIDIVVAGGGVFGLWAAKRAVEAGLRVALIEKDRIGAGASGGLLGALTAHAPDRWNPKKQFQFEALRELTGEILALEADTGFDTGYGRVGRLTPIRNVTYRRQLAARAEVAKTHWRMAETGLIYEPRQDAAFEDWLRPQAAPEGYLYDTLAARLHPRRYLEALAAWLRARGELIEGMAVSDFKNGVELSDGRRIAADALILATGVGGLRDIGARTGHDVGGASDGELALLRLRAGAMPKDAPLIYDNGVYVAPQGVDHVAIGGAAPGSVGRSLRNVITHANALCPALDGAELAESWTGSRPRCWRRDPVIGRLPGAAPLWVMNGGYKIGFGIAHKLARVLIDMITNGADSANTPDEFTIARHLEQA